MKGLHIIAILVTVAALLVSGIVLTSMNGRQPSSPSPSATNTPATAVTYTYDVVHAYPHDTNAFTEGLAYANGALYESTGLYGDSALRRVDLQTGNVEQEANLPTQFFGEGTTVVNDTIVQLTWREHVGFVYGKDSFNLLRNFTYPTEGWGLTYDGSRLIMSDGSDNLYFLDPVTYQTTGQVQVHDGTASISNLNELEYVNGDVYANIWHQQKIAVINPQTGQVKAWIDLTGLQGSAALSSEEVLNGIAYDAGNGRLLVTGKDWPQLFEINLDALT
jgi:glutamine cyclotransferase